MTVNSNVVTSTNPPLTTTAPAIDTATLLSGLAAQQQRIVGIVAGLDDAHHATPDIAVRLVVRRHDPAPHRDDELLVRHDHVGR